MKACKIVQVTHDHYIVQGGPFASQMEASARLPETWAWLVSIDYKVSYTKCNKLPPGRPLAADRKLTDCLKHGAKAHWR